MANAMTDATKENSVRTANGKFAPGHSGNPAGSVKVVSGRPRAVEKERELEYLGLLRKTLTPEDWMIIVGKQVETAKKGHLDAAKWLASYAIGQPRQAVDLEVDALAKHDKYTEAVRQMLEADE